MPPHEIRPFRDAYLRRHNGGSFDRLYEVPHLMRVGMEAAARTIYTMAAAYAGLAPSPSKRGDVDVEQGISKASNARLRKPAKGSFENNRSMTMLKSRPVAASLSARR